MDMSTKPKIHAPNQPRRAVVHRLADTLGIMSGLIVALWLVDQTPNEASLLAGAAATIFFFVASELTGMYRNWRGTPAEREFACVAFTWSVSIGALIGCLYLTNYLQEFRRAFSLSWWFLAAVLIISFRTALRWILSYLWKRGFNSRGFAVVGVNDLAFELCRRIEATPELGLRLIGFYDDRDDERLPEIDQRLGHNLGSLDALLDAARGGNVNMIFITFPMRAEDRIRNVLNRLGDTTASVYIVPDFFVFELLHSRWTNISGLPAVSVFENPLYGIDGFLKRACDVILASLILAIVAVPMMIIAILVKLSSPGPVFFRQKRYGLDGQEIMVWKFRSMKVCESGDKFTQAVKNDPRTTSVGRVLRQTSLDELPQLFNVLEGSMSLVGPRPHATKQNEEYRKLIQGYMLRHKVKPGITGLAQVNGWRGETDTLEKMEKRVSFDHRYIREWSLAMDLKILFKTIFVVLSRHNAH